MRIKSVNIAAFGGLKNKVIAFENGFNVLYGENENGKTTVMSFIKMMFYGSGRSVAQIAKNPRKKYAPWDGSAMAGSIDFELGGREYRLEKEFGKSDSTDKAVLCDLYLGTRQTVPSDIGTKLFGLSAAAFERSVFIGQTGAMEQDVSAEGEINSKLSNIVTTGDEQISFETVNARLEKAKLALMSKSGRAGEYDKNLKRMSELSERLAAAEKTYREYDEFKARSAEFRAEMAKSAEKAAEIKTRLDSERDVRNAEKLKEMLSLKAELDSLNEELKLEGGGIADEMFTRKLEFCLNKAENAEKSFADKSAEAAKLKESVNLAENGDGELNRRNAENIKAETEKTQAWLESLRRQAEDNTREYERKSAESTRGYSLQMFILSAVAFIAAAVLFFALQSDTPAISAGIVGVSIAVAGVIMLFSGKKKAQKKADALNELKINAARLEEEENSANQRLAELKERLETVNAALNMSTAALERQKALLEVSAEQLKTAQQELETEKSVLFELYGRYKKSESIAEIKAELEKISARAAKQREIKQRLNYVARDVGNISYDEAREKLSNLSGEISVGVDFDALKAEYERLYSEISEKRERLAIAQNTANTRLNSAENPESIKKEMAELKEKMLSQAEFCRSADIAAEVLRESFAELRKSYGSALEKKAGEIFAELTGGEYGSMQISKSFDISVEKNGTFGGKDAAYLSAGTVDQAYLSLRLALSELMFETSEKLPVFLDDALTQYDDRRAETALKYLNRFSSDRQSIMFTCHRAVYDTAESIGAFCAKI